MLLLKMARAEDVAMGTLHNGLHIGWTTDETKAEKLRDAGAQVTAGYNATGPCGWEIVFAVGRQAT